MKKLMLFCFGLLLTGFAGCGSGAPTAPAASQSEMEQYNAANPAPPTVEVPSE